MGFQLLIIYKWNKGENIIIKACYTAKSLLQGKFIMASQFLNKQEVRK